MRMGECVEVVGVCISVCACVRVYEYEWTSLNVNAQMCEFEL